VAGLGGVAALSPAHLRAHGGQHAFAQFFGADFVLVQAEHPFGVDDGQGVAELRAGAFPRALDNLCPGRAGHVHGAVGAEGIDHQDLVAEGQRGEAPVEQAFAVVGEHKAGDGGGHAVLPVAAGLRLGGRKGKGR